MRPSIPLLLLAALLALPASSSGQEPTNTPDSDSLRAAGAEAGAKAASDAAVGLATWGSAAVTVVFGPLGGAGAILFMRPPASFDTPSAAPDLGHASQQPAFQDAYREAYRAAYRKRFRRAVVRSALTVSALQIAGMLLLGG